MVGRNDLCPCGSGKKYKKCCLIKDEAKEIARNRIVYGKKQLESVIQKVLEFSNKEEYKNYKNKCEIDFGIGSYELENFMNIYYLTNYKYSKQSSIMFDYFNRNKQTLNKHDLEIVENILNSYVSIYQVKEKDINKILLRDILLNQNVYVEDIDLFSNFEVEDCLLARIVSIGNTKIFLDKSVKIDEDRKNKIKTDIDNRYRETKKKTKTKKQCLINNIKLMYENIIQVCYHGRMQIAKQLEKPLIKPIDNKITNQIVKPIEKQNIEESKKQIVKPIEKEIVKENKEQIIKAIEEKNNKQTVKSVDKENLEENEKQIAGSIENKIIEKSQKQLKDINSNEVKNIENKQELKQDIQQNTLKTQAIIAKIKKIRKQVFARKSRQKDNIDKNKKTNKRLEEKLKQRLEITEKLQQRKKAKEFIKEEKIENKKQIKQENMLNEVLKQNEQPKEFNNIQETNSELINKIESIPTYKVQQIESKIENNIVAQIATTTIKPRKQISINTPKQILNNLQQKETVKQEQASNKLEEVPVKREQLSNKSEKASKKQEQSLNKLGESSIKHDEVKTKQEQCRVYDVLMSNVENEYKDKCTKAWKQFKKLHKSYKGSENGWAAAIEYSVRKIIDETVTQEQISKKYNVSVKTLGKRYKELKIS